MNWRPSSDVTDQLSASFEQTLAAGTYYIRVTGVGNRTWSTGGYDDYGSLGAHAVEIGGYANLATYIPSGSTNSNTPLPGTSQFNNVTLGGLTQHNTSGSTNTDTWPISWDAPTTQDLNEYVSFTVTPGSNAQLDVQQLSVTLKSWVSGSSLVAIRSSVDNFAANIDSTRTLAASASGDFTFNVATVPDSSAAVELRLYVWSGGAGFRDLQRLNLTGRTVPTNPPNNAPDDYGNLPNATAYPLALSGGTKGHGSATGNFELVGDRDVFQITVEKGSLTIALNGVNDLDTYLRVFNSAGTQIAFDDDSGRGTEWWVAFRRTAWKRRRPPSHRLRCRRWLGGSMSTSKRAS